MNKRKIAYENRHTNIFDKITNFSGVLLKPKGNPIDDSIEKEKIVDAGLLESAVRQKIEFNNLLKWSMSNGTKGKNKICQDELIPISESDQDNLNERMR